MRPHVNNGQPFSHPLIGPTTVKLEEAVSATGVQRRARMGMSSNVIPPSPPSQTLPSPLSSNRGVGILLKARCNATLVAARHQGRKQGLKWESTAGKTLALSFPASSPLPCPRTPLITRGIRPTTASIQTSILQPSDTHHKPVKLPGFWAFGASLLP